MAQALRLPEPSPRRCYVCGCDPVGTDVVEAGPGRPALLLAECPRCDHRWTTPLAPRRAAPARPALRVQREGVSAA